MKTRVDKTDIEIDGITRILKNRQLFVPAFQRSYAWTEQHVEELFSDIHSAITDKQPEYFVGSVVLINSTSGYFVVDGQQRLATVSILIAAVRDYMTEQGEADRARIITQEYLFKQDLRTEEVRPALRLNEHDHDFYLQTILRPPDEREKKIVAERKSHKRLRAAAKLAKQRVGLMTSGVNKPIDRLIDVVEYLCENVKVIQVIAPDDADAFVIFETLNDRGLDLSESDLLKNYLFSLAGERLNEFQAKWDSVVTSMEIIQDESIIVKFIRHFWSTQNGLTRKRHLYKSIRKSITSTRDAMEFANELEASSRIYVATFNPDHELWKTYGPAAKAAIETFNLFRMDQNRPLILAVLSRFTQKEVTHSLKLLVDAAVRIMITGFAGAGDLERGFAETAQKVAKGNISTARELARELSSFVPNDDTFVTDFSRATVSREDLARYYLRTLELAHEGKLEPEFVPNPNQSQITLEHVLPSKPCADWSHIDDQTFKAFSKRLGNLALLSHSENSDAGSDSFDKKKERYSRSDFALTASLADFSNWGPTEIESRQGGLAELAAKAWTLKV